MIPNVLIKTNKTKKGKSETHLRWWASLIISLALALGTWNPTGHHFIHYVSQQDMFSGFTPFAIIIMLGIWILAIKSIFQSIGWTGTIFTVIMILTFLWGLNQFGLFNFDNMSSLGWAGTVSVGFIIWVGLNASIIWKTITGVYATDSTED